MRQEDLKKPLLGVAKPIEFLLLETDTIQEAFAKFEERYSPKKILYFYVVNQDGKLTGIAATRALLLARKDRKISEVMESEVFYLREDQCMQDAAELFTRHNLLAFPVVDQENRLKGYLDIDACLDEEIDLTATRNRQDIFQMVGLWVEDGKKISIFRQYRYRMPWLFCNMFAGLICAVISRIYEPVLAKYLILAMFIPLVLTLSESTAMQSMTQSLHLLRRPRLSLSAITRYAFREWRLIFWVAWSSGIIIGLFSLFWNEGVHPAIVIGTGIGLSVTMSALFGIGIPILLHWKGLDPKIASGPVVLMFADILTTALYLALATAWLL